MQEYKPAKYLMIRIGDNDFSGPLIMIGKFIQKNFIYDGQCPEEKDFPLLEEKIKYLMWATNDIWNVFWNRYKDTPLTWFSCQLKIVDYFDIPYNDNGLSIYIPLFDGEMLLR